MLEQLDLEGRWPELFVDLDAKQRRAVTQSLAGIWHEGWEPNREDVKNLTEYVGGKIDRVEYSRRAAEAAERQRGKSEVD